MATKAIDRPAAVRKALRELVADRGFHGASMSAVAEAAGVATGTAYVHYESKESLVHATYLEIKQELGEAVLAEVDPELAPREFYGAAWRATYSHLSADPARARFLTQLEESPYYRGAKQMLLEQGDALAEQAGRPQLLELLVPLPVDLIYSMSLGTAVRLASAGIELTGAETETLIEATWRAITRE